MSGPDVPQLKPGDILALPLKVNSQPSFAPWRLIGDEGRGLVIPAIASDSQFAEPPKDGRAFLLREIASALIDGTRESLFAEASYVSGQNAITPGLMSLLRSKLAAHDDRWSQVAAAILSSLAIPRPSVADFLLSKDVSGGGGFSGSLITAVTVPEFAQEPSLIRELRQMLQARSSGTLNVARSLLITGQREILQDATTLSFYYVALPDVNPSELQAACWVIRDFGTDEQFGWLLGEVRRSQYRDQRRYDKLWRNLIWSDSDRERDVLEILIKDNRMFEANTRYSDIARGELTRLQNLKQ
jgi:hypothetical protein